MSSGITFNWKLGDNTGATGSLISKKYSSPGVYGTKVSAKNEWGTRISPTKFVSVLIGPTYSQILQDYTLKSYITGPVQLGTFPQGNSPIFGTDYFYSAGPPSSLSYGYHVNRMYVEINPNVGAMGGTVYCMSPTGSPQTLLSYNDSITSAVIRGRRGCHFPIKDLKYGIFLHKVIPEISASPILVYKGILRTPLENSNGIIEILDPSVRIPREVVVRGELVTEFPEFSKLKIGESKNGITADFLLNLEGATFEVMALALCPTSQPCDFCFEEESPGPTGPVLATYRVPKNGKPFQRNYDGDFIMDTVCAQNGDQLKIYGEYLIPSVNIYGLLGSTTGYKNAGIVDGVRIANFMEYLLPYSKNKKNVINYTSFAGVMATRDQYGANGASFGMVPPWHADDSSLAGSYANINGYQFMADQLLVQDKIQVENPITGEVSDTVICQTHTRNCSNGTGPVNGLPVPVNVKFTSLGYTLGRKYFKDRVYYWWSEVYPRLDEVGVKINCVISNITTELNKVCPYKAEYIANQHLPMINDVKIDSGCHPNSPCRQPNYYGVISLNPYEVSDGPGAPNSTERYHVTESGTGNVNPYNPFFKNWLYAHLKNIHTESSLYEFLTYVKGVTVNIGNVGQFIENKVYAFTKPGVFYYNDTGYVTGGAFTYPRGWTMEYYRGLAASSLIDTKIYSAMYDVVRGNEGLSGFDDVNFINYISADVGPIDDTGKTGSTYDNAVVFDFLGSPDMSRLKVGNVGSILWYGNTIRSHIWYTYGGWRFISERPEFNITNIPYYPLPSPYILQIAENTIYDNLSQKTYPFWNIVFNVNNFRSAWRSNSIEKKVPYISPEYESVSCLRDPIYRLEYNIHGLLHSSDDVVIPFFVPASGSDFSNKITQDSFREVNKVLQNNRKKLFTKEVYGYTYMSPTYLKRGPAGGTFDNLKNIPPLVTGVLFGGSGETYDYIAYRVTVPLPRIAAGSGNQYTWNGGGHGYYDFGATLSSTDTYPSLKYFDVKVIFPNGVSSTILLGPTSAGFWYLAPNNVTYQNLQFALV